MADRVRRPRMSKAWLAIPSAQLPHTSNSTSLGGALNFTAPGTVLRMLGEYLITNTGAITAGDSAKMAVAIGVVSTDAFTAGQASVPDPLEEPEYPWLYWADHTMFYPGAGAPLDTSNPAGSLRKSFDIRSMRRMRPRETLCFIVQYADLAGTPPIQLDIGGTRVLIGLH